jgi:hypothetical protein
LSTSRRPGTTLVEVLVSIFVMAIGMVALLALFPLGAFEMADAIRDDHVSLCVSNATSLATAMNLQHDSNVASTVTAGGITWGAFDLPSPISHVNISQSNPTPNPTTGAPWVLGPSYPVYVDPIGYSSYGRVYRDWVAGLGPAATPAGTLGIKRAPANFALNSLAALQWCTFLDDINFDKNGLPFNPTAPATRTFQRNYGYSWAYLLRRPKNAVPSVVQMWVVVYQQRPLTFRPGGDESWYNVSPAWTSAVAVNSPKNVVTLTSGGGGLWPPAIRAGSWILDCSPGPPLVGPTGVQSSPGNARFYHVVAVTDKSATTMDVEVDTPIIGPAPAAGAAALVPWVPGDAVVPPSRFAVLDNVVEVIYKGTTWLP